MVHSIKCLLNIKINNWVELAIINIYKPVVCCPAKGQSSGVGRTEALLFITLQILIHKIYVQLIIY